MNKLIFRLSFLVMSLGYFIPAIAQQNDVYQNPGNNYRMAMTLYREAAYNAAGTLFQKVLNGAETEGSMTENASFYLSECALKTNRKDAEFQLLKFVDIYPESSWVPSAQLSLGELYFNKRHYSQALKLFHKILPVHLNASQRQTYFYKKGYCLMKRNKTAEALNLFQKVEHTDSPYAQPASYFSAHIYYQLGNYDDALKGFLAVKDNRRYRKFVPEYLIRIYYQQGKYQKAVDLGKTYLETVDSKLKATMNRIIANAYYEMNDFQSAMPYFIAYENLERERIPQEEGYRMGYTYFKNKKYKEAALEFQLATTGDEAMAQNAWVHLAYCYVETGQPRFAQNAFIKAYELNQSRQLTQDALLAYARLSIQQKGDPARNVVNIVQKFVNNSEYEPIVRQQAASLLAQLYLNSHNNPAALISIEKGGIHGIAMQKIYQQLAYSQAISFYQQNNFREALVYFNKALTNTPDRTLKLKSLYWRADTYYRLYQFVPASKAYRVFLTASGASASGLYTRANYDLAYCYFNQKEYPQAVVFFKRFLNQKSGDISLIADAGLRIADSYVAQSDFADAQLWYDQVLESGGQNAAYVLYQKAYAFGAEGKFQQKVQNLLKLTASYPHSSYYSRALYDLASTFNSVLNDPRRSIIYFERLVKERPASSYARKAQVKMGLLYYKNNQNDRAMVVLKNVIRTYPASQEASVALSTLESIYKDEGHLAEYFAYAKTLDFVQVSRSQEDSLTFSVGEDAYLAGNCPKVISSLTDYVRKFQKGGFVLKAYHYLSDCYTKQKDTVHALSYFHKIIDFPVNEYSVPALLNAARMEYARHLYDLSAKHYQMLGTLSEDPSIIIESLDGQMRSSYLLGNLQEAEQSAHALLKTPKVNDEQIIYAHYVLAKSSVKAGNLSVARREFNIVSKLQKGAMGAESSYELAMLFYGNRQYDEAEKQVYALSDRFPGQLYWVAKGFILLSDVYVERGNLFQARETLKSVLDNYPGKDLKKIAGEKLKKLPADKTVTGKSNKPSASK